MNIKEIAAKDALTQFLIDEAVRDGELLNLVNFKTFVGNSHNAVKATTATAISARAVNAQYPNTVATTQYELVGRKIFGQRIMLDTVTLESNNINGASLISAGSESVAIEAVKDQLQSAARGFATLFYEKIIRGNTATLGTDFNGFIVKAGETIGFDTLFNNSGNGIALTQGSSDTAVKAQQVLITALNIAIEKCAGINRTKVILCNSDVMSALRNAQKVVVVNDASQAQYPIDTFNGIVRIINLDNLTTVPLAYNETRGTSINNTASIYVFQTDALSGFNFYTMPNNGIRVSPPMQNSSIYEWAFDAVIDAAPLHQNSIVKIGGILKG